MKSLFEEPQAEFAPAADRPSPTVWVRRLVVVERREPDITPIREVDFRRGLNIIATARPREDVDGPVGHNVGKTLLTRLIRYCLGEQHYARERVRTAIARSLPDAFVIAEIVVEDRCWIVARPIGVTTGSESVCTLGDDWRAILPDDSGTERYSTFVGVVEEATVGRFSETLLPHQNRPVTWRDLLAWLSRDQYCRYRQPLEWRTAWTESGTGSLHEEDASVLIRLMMDLLDDEEIRLICRHKELLADKAGKAAEVKQLEDTLAKTRDFLEQRLRMDDELLSDDLFGKRAVERAEEEQETLRRKRDGVLADSGLSELESQLRAAERSVTRKEQEIDTRKADRQTTEGELKGSRSASDDVFVASFAELGNSCTLPPDQCPLKGSARKPGQRDAFREMLVRQKTTELQRIDQQVAELENQLLELTKERDVLGKEHAKKAKEIEAKRVLHETQIWRLNALIDEAKQLSKSHDELGSTVATLAKLESDVRQSRESHHAAHEQLQRRKRTLDLHFNRVLNALMALDGQGRIDIDMRGIHLIVDEQGSTPGEAMTSESALALDLACLSASISGLGCMPRLVIHDSPREADLEPHIYARLFRFVASLQDQFPEDEAAFQYIVATTTPPPAELDVERFVRLRLDARDRDGLLLKRRF